MRCIDCNYYYQTFDENYMHCHFEGPEGEAPCEWDEYLSEGERE